MSRFVRSTGRGTAGDGRDSPLKYTIDRARYLQRMAGDGRDSPLKYTRNDNLPDHPGLGMAGIHRSSTLGSYFVSLDGALGMAGIHRSSTLAATALSRMALSRMSRLGMAGIHRSSTLRPCTDPDPVLLGMAGIHRSSTLMGSKQSRS